MGGSVRNDGGTREEPGRKPEGTMQARNPIERLKGGARATVVGAKAAGE